MNKKTNTIFFRQSVKEKNADGNLLSWFSVQFNRALDVMNQAVTSPGGLLQPGAKENIAYLTSTERRLASLWFWILSRSNTLGAKSRKIDTFMRRDAGGWGGGGKNFPTIIATEALQISIENQMEKTVSFFLNVFLISSTVVDVRYVKPLFSFVLVNLHSFVQRASGTVSLVYLLFRWANHKGPFEWRRTPHLL